MPKLLRAMSHLLSAPVALQLGVAKIIQDIISWLGLDEDVFTPEQ